MITTLADYSVNSANRTEIRSTFQYYSCSTRFDIRCADDEIAALIEAVFGGVKISPPTQGAARRVYSIDRLATGALRVASAGDVCEFDTADDMLFHVDKSITIELQHCRPDLLFVHGAALACQDRVAILAAPSGIGKSTLASVALQRGLEYLSDELAPIDLRDLTVHPYPRSPYLKTPSAPHTLADGALDHGGRRHVPLTAAATRREPAPLAALIFLRREPCADRHLRPISRASAATRLMANTLNLLSHPAAGLDAAVAVSGAVESFELDATDLTAASDGVLAALSK